MVGWPSINFTSASSGTTTPLSAGDNEEILPDYYRFLDPLYSNRKYRPQVDVTAPGSYLDEEGHVYHSTYRFFPTTVPRKKRLPPEERPAYFQRFWDRVPEPEFWTPSQSTVISGQAREGMPHERTRLLLFTRLRGGLRDDDMNDDGRDSMSILVRMKELFRSIMVHLRRFFRGETEASVA